MNRSVIVRFSEAPRVVELVHEYGGPYLGALIEFCRDHDGAGRLVRVKGDTRLPCGKTLPVYDWKRDGTRI